jgi:transposase
MAALLDPLAESIGRHVRAGSAIHADDTPVPVLDPGRGKTKTGRLWVAVRDERPFGSTVPPVALYLYSSDRKAEHARNLLEMCRGFLHADGYAGFADLYQPDPKTGGPSSSKSPVGRMQGANFMTCMLRRTRPPHATRWT